MLQIFYSPTEEAPTYEKTELSKATWLRCEKPSDEELSRLTQLGLDENIMQDALDPHEVPRIDIEDDWVYLITRLPDTDDEFNDFTTPILFALGKDYTVTLSRDSLGRLWQPFIDSKHIATGKQVELFVMMMEAIIAQYQRRVATINRQMRAATSDVQQLRSKDIGTFTEYERKLNDYLDALMPTNTALERLLGGKLLKLTEDTEDLVEDMSIDLKQIIARCKSLLRTITNLRDSYRAVMDTRLNETIRLLTVITLALTIPTMLAGLFGMNVAIPGDTHSPVFFWVIVAVSILFAATFSFYFLKKRQ